MLRLQDVTVQLGHRVILDRVTLEVSDRERLAIVGRNGAGKSTLLKVAAARIERDGGDVTLGRSQEVGYLEQEAVVEPGRTLWEEAFAAMQPVLGLQRRAEELIAQAEHTEGDAQVALLHQADELSERFRHAGGWQAEATCGRVLSGLGFAEPEWSKECAAFSGGWQVRIALARLILERPTFLLLDEPTNHLDLETRTWLLHELQEWPGGVVVIGHDRDFLDRLVKRTVEVDGGGLTSYAGGYSAYLAARELRIEQLRKAAIARDEERARLQVFIDRFRFKASKASQVQDRVKQLERLPRIVVPQLSRAATMDFGDAPPCGDPALEVRSLSRHYGALKVLEGADASAWRGERILLVGPNGAGKSTLLRLLAGRDDPTSGYVTRGPGVRVAWFAQDQAAELDPDKTVLQAVAGIDPLLTELRLRAVLGSLLFVGDDVHKKCGVLSGGERSRVALARVLLARANVLLLDEPTNHLDIESKAVLADALLRFAGTILFVSHDRAFADQVADVVWEVGGGIVARHNGNLDDFLWARAVELGVATRRLSGVKAPDAWLLGGLPAPPASSADDGGSQARDGDLGADAWKERKKRKAADDRRRKRLAELPAEIEALEVRIGAVHDEMAAAASDWSKLAELQVTETGLQERLEAAFEEWEELEAVG